MFSIKKWGAADCTICKPPHLPREIFDTIIHLPDLVKDGEVYKSLSDIFGTTTTEKDRLSLQSSAERVILEYLSILLDNSHKMLASFLNVQNATSQECCIHLISYYIKTKKIWTTF